MLSCGKNPCTVIGPGLPGKGIMNESRKMINWMAGVTTFVVALLIVIVLLVPLYIVRQCLNGERDPGKCAGDIEL